MITRSSDDASRVLAEVKAHTDVYLDLETRGLDPWDVKSYVVGAAVKVPGGEAHYLPFRHPQTENVPIEVLQDLWALCCRPGTTVKNHNLPFDIRMLKVAERLPGWPDRILDSQVQAHLWDENLQSYALKRLIEQLRGKAAVATETNLIEYAKQHKLSAKADIYRMPASIVAPYAMDDVRHVEWLLGELDSRMRPLQLLHLVPEYMDYWLLLTKMELHGMQLDMTLVEQYLQEAQEMELVEEREFHRLCGQEVNPRSPKQLAEVLGIPSTAKVLIEDLDDERVRCLLRLRAWSKAARTFYDPYKKHVGPGGILHPHWWFVKTGRLSCRRPNLHAVPHRSEWFKVKDVFVARPDHTLVLCDWSQAEMRLCAHYTRDPVLMKAFTNEEDVHAEVAEQLKIPRKAAKNINYGAAYGMGARKLGRTLHIPEKQAREWLTKYHQWVRGPRALYRRMATLAESRWYIRMWDGRMRRFDTFTNWPRTASNSLLQGGVGAMARRAMLRLQPYIYEQLQGRMLLQIHDAILFELPTEAVSADWIRQIVDEMENFNFRVKIPVDIKVGPDWGHLKEWTLV